MSDFVVLYSLTCWSLHHLSVYRLSESLRGRTESPSVSIAADPEGGSGLPVVYSRRSREPRELATHSFDFGLQFRLWSDAEREIVPVRLQRANRVAREGGKTSFLVQECREVVRVIVELASPAAYRSQCQSEVTLTLCHARDHEVRPKRSRVDVSSGGYIRLGQLGPDIGKIKGTGTSCFKQRGAESR